MKILDTTIHHFGKFHQTAFQFDDHINVLYGKNGAGKSTLHTYLRSMLLGMERGRGRAAQTDDYSRYMPWEPSNVYGGSMRIQHEEGVYQLTRNFLTDARHLELFDETRSRPVTPAQPFLDQLLDGLNQVTYDNIISIGQLKCETSSSMADELNNYISNLHSAGSGNVDITAAVAQLTAQKKQLSSQLALVDEKEYVRLTDQIEQLNRQIQQESVDQQTARLYTRREQVKKTLSEQKKTHERLTGYVKEWTQLLHTNGMESKETVQQTLQVMNRAFNAYIRYRGAYRLYRLPLVRGLTMALSVLLYIASFFMLFFANTTFIDRDYPYVALEILLCVGFFAAGRILWNLNDKGWLWNEARLQLQSIFQAYLGGKEINSANYGKLKERLGNCVALFDKIEDCQNHCDRLAMHIFSLQSEENTILRQLEGLYKTDWANEQNREALKQALLKQETMNMQREANQSILTEIEAVQTAISTIQSIAENYHVSFVPRLNQECSRILSSLTGGVYTSMSTDDSLNIYIRCDGRNLPLHALSRGTVDQVYLALRLALLNLFWPGHSMPLLLDDSFALYDDDRLEHTLLWLNQHYDGQIFLFTCHTREENLLNMHNIDHAFITVC